MEMVSHIYISFDSSTEARLRLMDRSNLRTLVDSIHAEISNDRLHGLHRTSVALKEAMTESDRRELVQYFNYFSVCTFTDNELILEYPSLTL